MVGHSTAQGAMPNRAGGRKGGREEAMGANHVVMGRQRAPGAEEEYRMQGDGGGQAARIAGQLHTSPMEEGANFPGFPHPVHIR